MSVTTKAAILKAPYDIDLVDRELVCGEDEVIVKNHLIGICGSDKSFYRGQLPQKLLNSGRILPSLSIWAMKAEERWLRSARK